MKKKSKPELTLEILEIKDWLIGNPNESVDISLHGYLGTKEGKGGFCPIGINLYSRKGAKSVGFPFEFNKDYEVDALSRDIIGKKYTLKISEESSELKELSEIAGLKAIADNCPKAFGLLGKLGLTNAQIIETPYFVLESKCDDVIKAYAAGISKIVKEK